jgi:hypothetical protein
MNVMYTLFSIHAIAESLRNASNVLTHAFPEVRLWLQEETPHLSREVRGNDPRWAVQIRNRNFLGVELG